MADGIDIVCIDTTAGFADSGGFYQAAMLTVGEIEPIGVLISWITPASSRPSAAILFSSSRTVDISGSAAIIVPPCVRK